MSTNPTTSTRRPARIGTIVWGAILVAVAVFGVLLTRGLQLSSTAALWSIIGFGVLLVLAAVAAGVVRTVRRRPVATEPGVPESLDEHPPIG